MTNLKSTTIMAIVTAIAILSLGFFSYVKPIAKNKANTLISALEPRKNTKGTEKEWEAIQKMYNDIVANISKNPDDNKLKMKLAALYMNEARITGKASYYSAALTVIQYVAAQPKATNEDVFLAKSYQASVLLSLHQFAEAKKVAEEAGLLNTYDAGVYGALVDANVELGNYDEAVKMCDKMLSVRPDLRSYSRASYIRQIFGDNAGAIDAMKKAVMASAAGMESTEWARVNLGDLYLNIGKLDTAKWLYEAALHYRPEYAYAEMGLAKVARAEKKYDEALLHTKSAIKMLGESSFISFMADIYELKGDKDKAKEIRNDVLSLLEEGEAENEKEILAKHNGFRELAMAKLDVGNFAAALKDAQKDLALRPENVDANELIAWIYFKMGDMQNAKIHAAKMLRMNTQNTSTLYKASMIYAAAGDASKASELKMKALNLNEMAANLVML